VGSGPVFRGTRAPVQALFDSLEAGETREQFLEGFPSVSRDGHRGSADAKELVMTGATARGA
jgi:Protein of unknown function (DUF433)